jgi:transposase
MRRRFGDIPEHRLMSDEYRRIEVITGTARRRRWPVEEKLRIIGESCEPGESVSAVARRNGVAGPLRWDRTSRQHRSHSVAFKRQVAEEFLAGETLHGLAKRHDLCRNLIRVWVAKYEAGAFDEDASAADLIQAYEARIAALERLVGKQALELEFLRGASASAARARNAPTSVITGPVGSAPLKDAG